MGSHVDYHHYRQLTGGEMNRRIFVAALCALPFMKESAMAACSIQPGANLSKCDFSGQNLSGRDFSRTNLDKANFNSTDLTNANFSGANFGRSNLTGADLTGAKVSGANLGSAKFCNTIMPDGSVNDSDC